MTPDARVDALWGSGTVLEAKMNWANLKRARRAVGQVYFNSYIGLFAVSTGLLLWKHLWGWAVFTAVAMVVAWALARGHEEYGKASFPNAARVVFRSRRRDT